jgi:periplasmic divalent cation tolerance protein
MSQTIQVVTTIGSKDEARNLARTLLERRLAGCVQIVGPITSMYWWQGAIDEAEEYLCVIKTQVDRYEALENAIRQAHPYDVPEIIAISAKRVSPDYLHWLTGELNPPHA